MLKFNFSNPNVIPPWVRRLDQKLREEQSFRKSRSGGVLVIEPTERCSLINFIKEIQVSQYQTVDAFYKQGIDTRDTRIKRKNHTVCFFFARREFELSDEFKKERPLLTRNFGKSVKLQYGELDYFSIHSMGWTERFLNRFSMPWVCTLIYASTIILPKWPTGDRWQRNKKQ